MPSDLTFYGWPQRDLNPCYRLERVGREESGNSAECSTVLIIWTFKLWGFSLEPVVSQSRAAQTRPNARRK
jgi:hypothetical protein